MSIKIPLTWELARGAQRGGAMPEEFHFLPATVPGAVQLDYGKAHNMPDPNYNRQYELYQGLEDYSWLYRTKVTRGEYEIGTHEKILFQAKGVDYSYRIYWDQIESSEHLLCEGEGMFTPIRLDLTALVNKMDSFYLYILILPAPKREGAPRGRQQADRSVKPAVSYGWDWHPELIPLGIWDETWLEIAPAKDFHELSVVYELSEDLKSVKVILLGLDKEDDILFEIFQKNGKPAGRIEGQNRSVLLESISLWWPHDQGDPYLYRWTFRLNPMAQTGVLRQGHIGFRKTRLIIHEGGWVEPQDFPKSRSNPPITLEINGRPLFCKGSNWVNPDIFPGRIDSETYETLILLGKKANMNLFRIWGGGIVNKDAFYDICDCEGIMVWQEFPLACNNYEDDPSYLKILEQEADSIINRLKPHASVVLWCGGNELFNNWSGMTDQSLALRLLNSRCLTLDPHTPFIMTSPLMGMAHGYYLFKYSDGRDVLGHMIESKNTAYTEFGCPGPSSVSVLKRIIPKEELWPPRAGTAWEDHHGFMAWPGGGEGTWLCQDIIESYFGPLQSLEELVDRGQLLQTVGYKGIFEEARRQKPCCSMALNWCWNEPWPAAANNSLLNFPAQPKPAYFGVGESCRPILFSARIPRFSWWEDDCLTFELWLLNDSPEKVDSLELNCYLEIEGQRIFLLNWACPGSEANRNLIGPAVNFPLKGFKKKQVFSLILESDSRPEFRSVYQLLYTPHDKHNEEAGVLLNF